MYVAHNVDIPPGRIGKSIDSAGSRIAHGGECRDVSFRDVCFQDIR